jgi:cytoskeletal protein CcmA (bactofilin family)
MSKMDKAITFLGKDTEWDGKLRFDGTIRIDGHFKGEISSTGNLIVGEEGVVEADIRVSYIVNSGEIHGNLISDQRVDIHAPGKVFGSIQAPSVVIDKGVIFEGTTRMYQAKDANQRRSDVVEVDEHIGAPPPNLTAICGIVTNQDTGEPIKNAKISCKGAGKSAINTNASGYYELINLRDGKWKLQVEAKGYKRGSANVVISGGGTYEQNCQLKSK